jgi:hypothetical protein
MRRRTHSLEQIECTNNVDGRIVHRVHNAFADIHLGGEMHEEVELTLSHKRRGFGTTDVKILELGGGRHIGSRSRREIVNDDDGISGGE